MRLSALHVAPLALGLAWGTAGCDDTPPAKPGRALVTLFTLQGALAAGIPELGAGLSKVFPGMPPGYFLASETVIRIAPSYTNQRPAPYMTTDIWVNYPAVWIQPMYVFVTAWNASAPRMNLHPKHKWVLGVGPRSAFYSPFWETFYVELDAGVEDGTYKTVRDILAAGLRIHRGPGRLVAVVPPGMRPQPGADLPPPFDRAVAPLVTAAAGMGREGSPLENTAWIDGQDEPVEVLDFGPDRFEWNERGELVEQPLFFFFRRGGAGRPTPLLNAPRIGGTGPIFARRPAPAPANRPLFGSFWRLYAVHLPPGRGIVFIPSGPRYEAFRKAWADESGEPGYAGPQVVLAPSDWPPDDAAKAEAFALKVALEAPGAECLKAAADLSKCRWLDSQEAIETFLPHGVEPSEITVSCPYLGYAGAPVPRFPP